MAWTDMDALCEALRRTESREEAIVVVASFRLPAMATADPKARVTSKWSRAAALVCAKPGPERPRPKDGRSGPLFRRGGGM